MHGTDIQYISVQFKMTKGMEEEWLMPGTNHLPDCEPPPHIELITVVKLHQTRGSCSDLSKL